MWLDELFLVVMKNNMTVLCQLTFYSLFKVVNVAWMILLWQFHYIKIRTFLAKKCIDSMFITAWIGCIIDYPVTLKGESVLNAFLGCQTHAFNIMQEKGWKSNINHLKSLTFPDQMFVLGLENMHSRVRHKTNIWY